MRRTLEIELLRASSGLAGMAAGVIALVFGPFISLREFFVPAGVIALVAGAFTAVVASSRIGKLNVAGEELPEWVLRVHRFSAWVVRQSRPTPFWQKHMDDLVDWSEPSIGGGNLLAGVPGHMVSILSLMLGGALFIAALGMFVIGPLFLSPDFLTLGLADPIGRAYATICITTGSCNLPYLLAGTAIGVPVITLALLMVYAGLRTVDVIDAQDDDEPHASDYTLGDVVSAIEVLDQRIVRARADLVLAGVLPLSREELADAAEAADAAQAEAEVEAPF